MVDSGVLERPADDDLPPPAGPEVGRGRRTDDRLSERLALGVFVAYLLVAFFVLLSIGAKRYFFADDWDFIADRSLTNLGDLLRSHNGHWSTVPIVEYRLLYQVFGLDYTPYQVVGILVHLATAGLVRVVMRRCYVGPWTATAFAGLLVLCGTGADDILSAFQVSFVGSVAFGLVMLLLTHHPGPIDRRDWLALLAGLAALMSSGVGVSMVAGVGVAVLLARGWRAALFAVAPLAMIYVLWFKTVSHEASTGATPLASTEFDWVRSSFTAAFVGLGQHPVVAVLLVVLLVVGLVVAWQPLDRAERRHHAAMPIGLLASALLFASFTGYSRWFLGIAGSEASRYMYILIACLLVPLAVAGDAVIRRWPLSWPIVLVVVLLGVPGNLRALDDDPFVDLHVPQRHIIAAMARLPLARQVPGWGRVDPGPFSMGDLTIGQLVAALDAGHLPDPGPPAPTSDAQLPLRLSLVQTDAKPAGTCPIYVDPQDVHLRRGDTIGLDSAVEVVQLQDGRPSAVPYGVDPGAGRTMISQVPSLDIRIGRHGRPTYSVCR